MGILPGVYDYLFIRNERILLNDTLESSWIFQDSWCDKRPVTLEHGWEKIPRSALKRDISKTKRVTALYSSQILVCYYSVKSIPIYNGCLFEAGLTRNQPPEKQVESSLFWNFYWLCDLQVLFFHQVISAHGWASGWILIVTSGISQWKKETNCPPSKKSH